MNRLIDPPTVAPPVGLYSHAVEVPPNARLLFISGQLGLLEDGSLADGIEAQTEAAWRNVIHILESADMGLSDLVKVTTIVANQSDVPVTRAVRRRFFPGDEHPASTMFVVAALGHPTWLLEIEAVAAK